MADYYTHGGYPAQSAAGASVDARTEFDAIGTGFAKLAPYTGYAGRIVRINAGGTAQESVTLATATIESYADAQAGTHRILTTVAGTNTITATATPTLAAYVTNQTFQFAAAGANTGAATIAIDGLAAKNLVRPDGSALLAGDIVGAGFIANITIRAADAVLNNPAIATKASTVTSVTGATGNIAGSSGSCTGQAATVASVTGATGNIAGSSGSCTGNAATATLATTASTCSDEIGVGQTWQNVAASRALGTRYTNNTTRPIMVSVAVALAGAGGSTNLSTANETIILSQTTNAGNTGMVATLTAIIPVSGTYFVASGGGAAVSYWAELR